MRQACQSFLQSTQLSSAQSTLSLTTVPIVVQQQPLPVNTLLDGAMTTATKNAVPPRQPIETIGTATETAIYRDDDGTDGRVVASVTATAFDFDCRQGNGTAVPANLEQRTEAPTPKSNGSTTLTKPATSNHKQPISPFRSRQSRPLLLVQSLQPNDIVLMGATTSTAPSAAPSAASTSAATSISNRTASLAGRDQTDTATAAAAGAIAATPATTRAPTRRQPQPLRLLPPHDKAWTRHFRGM